MNEAKKTALTIGILMIFGLVAVMVEMLRDYGRRWLALIVASLIILILALGIHFAQARDVGQWENSSPAIHKWYQTLRQPDRPWALCCTEADAYWADEIHVRDGKTFAVVTDTRDDGPLHRPHIPDGTEFEIPPERLKYDAGNPTGHGILFVSTTGNVWCFVQGSGT